eukprot:jgi/Chrpa1/27014/Chrysochromulina_OHIO_Genome00026277-RA
MPQWENGKTADTLASTLACTTVADALVNYSEAVVSQSWVAQ